MLLPAGFALPTSGEPVLISDTTAASSNFALYHLIQLAQERAVPVSVLPHPSRPVGLLQLATFFAAAKL